MDDLEKVAASDGNNLATSPDEEEEGNMGERERQEAERKIKKQSAAALRARVYSAKRIRGDATDKGTMYVVHTIFFSSYVQKFLQLK
jgi:hypothetical protein